jgi:hypothetical protein
MPILLLLLALALYVPTVSKQRVVTDSQAAAASAWRIATTGRPWMEGVKAGALEGTRYPRMWIIETRQGHEVHARTPGVILAGVPFYWLLNNDPAPQNFEIWVGGVAAACFTAVAGLLMFLALRSRLSDGGAFVATSALLFATPVWSVSADALWTHSITVLAISGALWAATRSRWGMAGAFMGIGIFARAHLAVIAAIVGLYLGWRRRDWRITVRVAISSFVGLAMLVLWNKAVFGFWSLSGGYGSNPKDALLGDAGNSTLYNVANLLGFLANPDRGLLVWTPVILLLMPSLLAVRKQLPDWATAFALAGLTYTLVQLRINPFHGGQGFYGYRHGLELLVCMAPALIEAYKVTSRLTRLLIGLLLGMQFAVIAIGATADKYRVDGKDLWHTNAFIQALADQPLAFAALVAGCGLTGVVITGFVLRRSRNPELACVD